MMKILIIESSNLGIEKMNNRLFTVLTILYIILSLVIIGSLFLPLYRSGPWVSGYIYVRNVSLLVYIGFIVSVVSFLMKKPKLSIVGSLLYTLLFIMIFIEFEMKKGSILYVDFPIEWAFGFFIYGISLLCLWLIQVLILICLRRAKKKN